VQWIVSGAAREQLCNIVLQALYVSCVISLINLHTLLLCTLFAWLFYPVVLVHEDWWIMELGLFTIGIPLLDFVVGMALLVRDSHSYLATARCCYSNSVRLSVCLSDACILTKGNVGKMTS